MDDKQMDYCEMYPIYKCLSHEIEREFCGSKNALKVGKGNQLFVNYTWGSIVYTPDIDKVLVCYSLRSQKYKKEIKEKLVTLYAKYQDICIEEEKVHDTMIDFLTNPCEMIVTIPTDVNKQVYWKTDIATKQQLRVEAYQNIKNGLVVLDSGFGGENDQGFSMVKK